MVASLQFIERAHTVSRTPSTYVCGAQNVHGSELLLVTWGVFFISSAKLAPVQKARNFAKSYKRGIGRARSISVMQRVSGRSLPSSSSEHKETRLTGDISDSAGQRSHRVGDGAFLRVAQLQAMTLSGFTPLPPLPAPPCHLCKPNPFVDAELSEWGIA